ncbi:hypothetical protein GCM10010497_54600 [Streptomyces cinereoruber]|uniref:Secreted protein n=1 Tax=Streptomyces cinereoruber TaxID=67260 RepID=A0AAV4KRX4_9ACTN|nr:hypothetical protein [Streptomyces cinereoruber]MBB4161547.1 cell wall-associated NlpC family hydrolase [Streptomyces cinereoruber]MBY8818617.1 hypothetical protein [Streptomyces cinereoruber]NIH60843.1 cell wall-associated NlpC family hydrolase [Streptomyces cinereoruber]QEV33425.1 hypothetical protein CP977_15640 [Streptomyces cinereoruber]GGR44385.1 hypothetical protein GCM10010497_54600 [Streptomyces cinereoruber]
MPRGRHRHSPPLHKLLPPSAVAGAAVVCAAAAWLPGDLVVVRLLTAAAAAAAVTGAVLMRSWDRSAGLRVAETERARAADQWRAEERIAELESDLEESRALRARLDAKLRAKRVELAGLRGEHADLLRRYATAETERASALEGRRVLALESAGDTKALPAAGSALTPEAFRRAALALRDLPRNAAAQQARRTAEAARARDLAERARETEEPQGKHAAAAGTEQHTRPAAPALALPPAAPVPVAAAIVPYASRRPVPRPEGGFDFFGTQKTAEAIEAVQNTDLADVVGEEVLAAGAALGTPALVPATGPAAVPGIGTPVPPRTIGQVIDLTAHDETEQLDLAELRGAVNS